MNTYLVSVQMPHGPRANQLNHRRIAVVIAESEEAAKALALAKAGSGTTVASVLPLAPNTATIVR